MRTGLGSAKSVVIALVCSAMFCGTCFAGFFKYDIDDYARKAKKRIEEIDKKIAEDEAKKELESTLVEIQEIFEKAEALYGEGKYEEASELYRKIEEMSKDKDIKEMLRKSGK